MYQPLFIAGDVRFATPPFKFAYPFTVILCMQSHAHSQGTIRVPRWSDWPAQRLLQNPCMVLRGGQISVTAERSGSVAVILLGVLMSASVAYIHNICTYIHT